MSEREHDLKDVILLAPSRRYSIAEAMTHAPLTQELSLAVAEWAAQEQNRTVRTMLLACLETAPESSPCP